MSLRQSIRERIRTLRWLVNPRGLRDRVAMLERQLAAIDARLDAALSMSGAVSHSPSRRVPSGVFVRSSTPASEPSRRPVATARTSSRLRREASSISMRWPGRQAASVSMRATAVGSFSSR